MVERQRHSRWPPNSCLLAYIPNAHNRPAEGSPPRGPPWLLICPGHLGTPYEWQVKLGRSPAGPGQTGHIAPVAPGDCGEKALSHECPLAPEGQPATCILPPHPLCWEGPAEPWLDTRFGFPVSRKWPSGLLVSPPQMLTLKPVGQGVGHCPVGQGVRRGELCWPLPLPPRKPGGRTCWVLRAMASSQCWERHGRPG